MRKVASLPVFGIVGSVMIELFPKNLEEALKQYAANGPIGNPNCTAANCVHRESALAALPWGFMYGVNIIDPWTKASTAPDGSPAVDIYWNVSPWQPYQMDLMKSQIQ